MTAGYASDIAFTPAVKSLQASRGSRRAYANMEANGSWQTDITPDLAAFIAEQRSVFLATVNAQGQPYIQHRGGPPGFLRVLDAHTLGFIDFTGALRTDLAPGVEQHGMRQGAVRIAETGEQAAWFARAV